MGVRFSHTLLFTPVRRIDRIMPQPPNRALRLLVPIAIGILGGFLVWAVFTNTRPKPAAQTQQTGEAIPSPTADASTVAAGAQPANPAASDQAASMPAPATTPTASPTASPPASPAPTQAATPAAAPSAITSLAPRVFANPASTPTIESDEVSVKLSVVGGGIESITLKKHFTDIRKTTNIVVQSDSTGVNGGPGLMVPFAAEGLEVTLPAPQGSPAFAPMRVTLYANTAGVHWQATSNPGELEAIIVDQDNRPALRVMRAFAADGFNIEMKQYVENLSALPLSVRVMQYGPVDNMPPENNSYVGDPRRLRFGSMYPQNIDPNQRSVSASNHIEWHRNIIPPNEPLVDANGSPVLDTNGKAVKGYVPLAESSKHWPDETAKEKGLQLSWMGFTSRYWGIAAGPLSAPDATGSAKQLAWVDSVYALLPVANDPTKLGLFIKSRSVPLAPAGLAGSTQHFDMKLFAGPLDRALIASDPWRGSLAMKDLVFYNFGGPCGPCTFQPLANGLLGLLRFLHDNIFKDWAMAIIMLVIIVRTLLHPVTKWSQIRMARFGKQMGAMAPKQKELQEKYKDDPAKLREETARLWSQEGVSPAGMLGCIPMFLQMPVWLALSASLYFGAELREQGAFWGVFQAIQPQTSPFWNFLGDLSHSDRFIYFGKTVATLPILGEIRAINILPVLLGIVFYAQQKYMTPTTGPMTPEQELQMKMFKWMSVFMFPLFMYNAPSGLAIYFLANSALAIVEGKWIRHQMEKHGMLDLDKMKAERAAKKKSNQMGFLERMQKVAAEQEQKRRNLKK